MHEGCWIFSHFSFLHKDILAFFPKWSCCAWSGNPTFYTRLFAGCPKPPYRHYVRHIVTFLEQTVIINDISICSGYSFYWMFNILLGTIGSDWPRLSHLFSTITSRFFRWRNCQGKYIFFSKFQLDFCSPFYHHFIAQSLCPLWTSHKLNVSWSFENVNSWIWEHRRYDTWKKKQDI